MRSALPLQFESVGPGDCLHALLPSSQAAYIISYLKDLDASSVLLEPQYFDRDYLDDFAAFYSVSARGYDNTCRRAHFFSGRQGDQSPLITRQILERAMCNDRGALEVLQAEYLGFAVLKPNGATPFGRTVLRWHPNKHPERPRIVGERPYECNVGGVRLVVKGLAWQQQDQGVSACATVALWSTMHLSAYDERHAIPTTAQITRAAHRTASLGSRVFPARGLALHQLCEAVKECGFSPVLIIGDFARPTADAKRVFAEGFSRDRFAGTLANLIRSGYPILLLGKYIHEGRNDPHAVCLVGFRENGVPDVAAGGVAWADASIQHVYVHDDNIGPSARFALLDQQGSRSVDGKDVRAERVVLVRDPPGTTSGTALPSKSPWFLPTHVVVAVHHDLRTDPDVLHRLGSVIGERISRMLVPVWASAGKPGFGTTVGTQFLRVAAYLGEELELRLRGNAVALGKARLELVEMVPPMSLFVGVIRISVAGRPFVDILCDTTDSDCNHSVFAHVAYDPLAAPIIASMSKKSRFTFGPAVTAF